MDEHGFAKAVLMGRGARTTEEQRASSDDLAKLCSADRKRLLGFARIDPRIEGVTDEVRRCREKLGLVGIKMLPDHWAPCDEFMFPVYGTIESMGMPILFHSGILWGNADSSRFCRPALYESVIHFPKLKIALAHIGWPWTDECIAVANRFVHKARGEKRKNPQVFIDTTRGTPTVYRRDALKKAIACCGVGTLISGSDSGHCEDFSTSAEHAEMDVEILSDLGCSEQEIDMILGSNLDKLLEAD
jgi:predicted TIM-barrel fold metal-dependent hydrolase